MVIRQGGELCNCGRRGCWERYASATGLIRRRRRPWAHPESAPSTPLAAEARRGGPDGLSGGRGGETRQLLQSAASTSYLAEGVTNLVNILPPEAVAFGGGVAGAPEGICC